MIMKFKFIAAFFMLFVLVNFHAQKIQKLIYDLNGAIEIYTENFLLKVDKKGNSFIISPYNFSGTTDYFDNYQEQYNYGKIKNIGDITVEYWNVSDERDARYGKVKRIGNVEVDYWTSLNYESEKFGRIKNIGEITFDYYKKDGFDTENEGKIKSIGNVFIEYWTDMSDKAKFGKLKSFGSVKLDYYNDYYGDKLKFGKLKSVVGNTGKIQVRAEFGFSFNGNKNSSSSVLY